jgi:hypothetical protein
MQFDEKMPRPDGRHRLLEQAGLFYIWAHINLSCDRAAGQPVLLFCRDA